MSSLQGRIYKILADIHYINTDTGPVMAKARGRFRKDNITPLVGDKVTLIAPKRENELYLIDTILPRENELQRPPVANIDKLVIVMAPCRPSPDLLLADMLIAYCKYLGIKPVICINKCDIDTTEAEKLKAQFTNSNITALTISAKEKQGIEELENELSGGVACFAGQSAVGKSTIINLLLPQAQLATGDLSKKTERGKHTTRHCEILYLPNGGQVIDTPGFSMLEQIKMPPEEFSRLYDEYEDYSLNCRFRSCSHTNEPGCAVKNAVENGELSKERYDRYVKIYNTIREDWKNRYD